MENTICKSCGNEIPAGNPFCPICGAAQPKEEPIPANKNPEAVVAPQWPINSPEPKYAPPVYSQQSQYTPPVYSAPRSPVMYGEEGGGMGWIVFLRVMLWIIFAAGIIAALIAGIEAMQWDELTGIGIILAGVLASFLTVAGGMVALNNASNHRKTASNTAKIIRILQEKK